MGANNCGDRNTAFCLVATTTTTAAAATDTTSTRVSLNCENSTAELNFVQLVKWIYHQYSHFS